MNRSKLWLWAAAGLLGAAILIGLGIDIGLRLADRAEPVVVHSPPKKRADVTRVTRAAPMPNPFKYDDQDPYAAADAAASERKPPLPDPINQQVRLQMDRWTKAAQYEDRSAEGPMPQMAENVSKLVASSEAAQSLGDVEHAVALLQEAEAAASDARRQEELKSRRLWLLIEDGDVMTARQIANELGEDAVRLETRQMAAEVLVKLDGQ